MYSKRLLKADINMFRGLFLDTETSQDIFPLNIVEEIFDTWTSFSYSTELLLEIDDDDWLETEDEELLEEEIEDLEDELDEEWDDWLEEDREDVLIDVVDTEVELCEDRLLIDDWDDWEDWDDKEDDDWDDWDDWDDRVDGEDEDEEEECSVTQPTSVAAKVPVVPSYKPISKCVSSVVFQEYIP